jgi:hypothetical protein
MFKIVAFWSAVSMCLASLVGYLTSGVLTYQ